MHNLDFKMPITRLKALLLAGFTLSTLTSCKANLEATPDVTDSISINTSTDDSEYLAPIETYIAEETKAPVIQATSEPIEEKSPISSFQIEEPCSDINSPLIAGELEKMAKGEVFHFPYVTGQCKMAFHSHYDLTKPLFKQLEIDGIKYLVDANDENKVFVSDYDWLGYPYYLYGYDKANGGMDPESEFSGWVIPVYKNIGREDPVIDDIYDGLAPRYTFNLYDFETFRPLIIEAVPDYEFVSYGTDCFGTPGPITSRYVRNYDPAQGGKDKGGPGAGYVIDVSKWKTNYLVDVNDFETVIASEYGSFWSYDNGVARLFTDGKAKCLTTQNINPTKSDILIRRRLK